MTDKDDEPAFGWFECKEHGRVPAWPSFRGRLVLKGCPKCAAEYARFMNEIDERYSKPSK